MKKTAEKKEQLSGSCGYVISPAKYFQQGYRAGIDEAVATLYTTRLYKIRGANKIRVRLDYKIRDAIAQMIKELAL